MFDAIRCEVHGPDEYGQFWVALEINGRSACFAVKASCAGVIRKVLVDAAASTKQHTEEAKNPDQQHSLESGSALHQAFAEVQASVAAVEKAVSKYIKQ